MAFRVKTSQLNQYHPTFEFEGGSPSFFKYPGALNEGVAVNPDDVPKKAVELSKFKKLPDVIQMPDCWAVCDTFRRIVEEFEPNIHQFFPIALLRGQKDAPPEVYYLLNIRQCVDAIIPEESDVYWSKSTISGETTPVFNKVHPRISVRKGDIESIHLWRGHRYFRFHVFVSNLLFEAFQKLKIKKLDAAFADEK